MSLWTYLGRAAARAQRAFLDEQKRLTPTVFIPSIFPAPHGSSGPVDGPIGSGGAASFPGFPGDGLAPDDALTGKPVTGQGIRVPVSVFAEDEAPPVPGTIDDVADALGALGAGAVGTAEEIGPDHSGRAGFDPITSQEEISLSDDAGEGVDAPPGGGSAPVDFPPASADPVPAGEWNLADGPAWEIYDEKRTAVDLTADASESREDDAGTGDASVAPQPAPHSARETAADDPNAITVTLEPDVMALLRDMAAELGDEPALLARSLLTAVLLDDAKAHQADAAAPEPSKAVAEALEANEPEIVPPPQPIDIHARNRAVIAMAKTGVAPKQLAEHFGISQANASLILSKARKDGHHIPKFTTAGERKRSAIPASNDDITDIEAAE